jgi:hypothetical protein
VATITSAPSGIAGGIWLRSIVKTEFVVIRTSLRGATGPRSLAMVVTYGLARDGQVRAPRQLSRRARRLVVPWPSYSSLSVT